MLVQLSRDILADIKMPKSYWFLALQHTITIQHYLPVLVNGSITLLFKLVHGVNPDYCTLFRLFSTGYFEHTEDGTKVRGISEAQILAGIAIGRYQHSDVILFYHPPTKT